MRITANILIGCLILHGSAQAEENQVKRGPPPSWASASELLPVPADASGLVFIRRQDLLVHLDGQGQSVYTGQRIKILHQKALQLGNLSLAWNPAAGAPVVHAVNLYRDGTVIDVLKDTRFEVLRREGQLEQAVLDGTLTAVARIADVRVGDELEFVYTTRSINPTLGATDSGTMFLQPNPSPGRIRLGLSWIEGQNPSIKMTEFMAAAARKGDRSIEFTFDNAPSFTPAKDAPQRFAWKRIVEYSDFTDWASVSQRFFPLYVAASTLAPTSPLQREIDRIAAAHADPMARARAALKLVQQDVRYVFVGLGNGNLTPATADETWQRRYGDCKGKTTLLMALLAGLGIDAEPILVSNSGFDDGLDERLPAPGHFDHVLVRARIGGEPFYLDGTLPSVALPSAKPVLPYRWVLPLSAAGSTIEPLAWKADIVPNELSLVEIDARKGFDQPATITATTIRRGIAGLESHATFSGLTPGELKSQLSGELIGSTWQAIDDVRWRYDEQTQAGVMVIAGTGTVDWEDDGRGRKSMALPSGGFSPPERRVRAPGEGQDLPFANNPGFSCDVTTVFMPANAKDKNWSHKDGFNTRIFGRNYYRAIDVRGGAVRMVRAFRVEERETSVIQTMQDNARIAAFDNSMAWVFFDPNDSGLGKKPTKLVPTTQEIDWIADASPCLPPSAK